MLKDLLDRGIANLASRQVATLWAYHTVNRCSRPTSVSRTRHPAGGSSSWFIGGCIQSPTSDLDGIGRIVQ